MPISPVLAYILREAEEFAFCDTSIASGWPLLYQTNTHMLEESQAFYLQLVKLMMPCASVAFGAYSAVPKQLKNKLTLLFM